MAQEKFWRARGIEKPSEDNVISITVFRLSLERGDGGRGEVRGGGGLGAPEGVGLEKEDLCMH